MLAHAYEYVCAIEKYQNISKAAASLCITQPALTKYINRLEKDLQVQLFDRSATPIALTDAGKKFAEKAHIILNLEAELMSELNHLSDSPHGTLSVGMTTELCSTTLPYILPRFQKLYPHIHLNIKEGANHLLLDYLKRGKIELALIASPPKSDDLFFDDFQTESLILAIPADHPVAKGYDLSANSPLTPYYLPPEQITGADFIVCSPEVGMGRFANEMFRKYDLKPNIILEMRRNEAALRMASAGTGMVFIPARTALRIELLNPMAYFSIENPVSTRKRYLCYDRHTPLSQAAACFIPVLKNLFQENTALRDPVCQLIPHPVSH